MHRKRIIIADISRNYMDNLTAYFTQRNIDVIYTCSSGIELVETVKSASPDAVIMNLILKDLDGINVLKRLGSVTGKIPFIICTELYNETTIRLAQRHGAREYFCKPALPEAIYDFLCECTEFHDESLISDISDAFSPDSYLAERLAGLGISTCCNGYSMIISAVKNIIKEPALTNGITKRLYPLLAESYHTTSSNVERNIRSAIQSAFKRGSFNTYSHAPTNKELILELSREASGNISLI